MKWLVILTLLSNSFAFAEDFIITKNKTKFIVKKNKTSYFSNGCESVSDCFELPKKFRYYPSQSPLFSLCYQSKGEPAFGFLNGNEKMRKNICIKDDKVVELNSLMKEYKKLNQK